MLVWGRETERNATVGAAPMFTHILDPQALEKSNIATHMGEVISL